MEELERQKRLRRAALDEDEGNEEPDADRDQRDALQRSPRFGRSAEAREEHDARESAGERRRTEIVDRVPHVLRARVEHGADDEQRERADRQVHVEDPAPAEVVDEEAAEQWADHGRHTENRAEHSLVAPALARRNEVADDGNRRDEESAGAESLERAEADQLDHVLRDAAERGADEEDDDRGL